MQDNIILRLPIPGLVRGLPLATSVQYLRYVFTKPPLFQRNRLTCSGNPSFESCVEGKAQQREFAVYSRSSFQRPQN